MSAKKNSSQRNPGTVRAEGAAAAGTPPAGSAPAAASPDEKPSWLESTDPRRRTFAKIALVAIWIYVAALWLLALDQWFNWGIFGPKIPPLP